MTSTRHQVLIAAAALAGAAMLAASGVRACPQQLPSGMKAVSVSESLAVNGIGVAILQVESREAVPALLERLEKQWRGEGYAVRRNQAEAWNVLSALGEKCMTTLQLVERGGSFGYLAVNRFDKPMAARLPEAPMPSGARVLSTVLSDDDGRKARTTVLAASQSVEQLTLFYKRALEQQRWSSVRASATARRDLSHADATVSAQRGRERIEVVIVHEGGSRVVINVATEL